jgi:hypothetical protein
MASFGTGSRAPVIPWLAFQSSRVRLPSQSFQRRELHFGPCRNLASHDQLVSRKAGKMSVIPDPDFEDFARDCIRLAHQEKSRELRSRLLILARDWMHAAVQNRADPKLLGGSRVRPLQRRARR